MITPDNPYFQQVRLLVIVLPYVAAERCFALKGGTAINLFVRDMPRLSVDIDLAYVPLSDRQSALREIDAAMMRIKGILESGSPAYGVRVSKRVDGCAYGLIVRNSLAEIKIEVTPVLRGSVYSETDLRIVPNAEKAFGFAETPALSFENIYAGKLVAALDRQHPRDLFDVAQLLENEGVSDRLFKAFLVYLISHDGSLARLINPAYKPLGDLYEKQFKGMTVEPVTVDYLEKARQDLISVIHSMLDDGAKRFLVSFKKMNPDWGLLGVPHAKDLPAVQWKLRNLGQMSPDKHADAVGKLEDVLSRIDG
ncbi:MAG: nucleotidyl transferase AbiEii/AbiGii toxin family protein [Burkholderiales bacterium]|nr:nucleotidyl transferase AbiEii/AbiGii toxin family protein [Burkholderiales bacterium]